jgi:hypothetical protein
MAGAQIFFAQEATTASSGTSRTVECSGLDMGPVAQIIISSAATVLTQQTFTPDVASSWVTQVTTTSSDSIELDPRGVFYRFTWTGNNGTLTIPVGPGVSDGKLANVTVPASRSQAPS